MICKTTLWNKDPATAKHIWGSGPLPEHAQLIATATLLLSNGEMCTVAVLAHDYGQRPQAAIGGVIVADLAENGEAHLLLGEKAIGALALAHAPTGVSR